jgi:hypothetical protein
MPREAAQLGAASVLVPLLEIAPMLLAKLCRMFPPVPQIGPSFAKTRPSIFCPDTKL